MKRFLFALALVAAFCLPAWAQQVTQSGPITRGHAAQWLTNGVIGDAGTASAGSLTTLGTTGQGPTICANSGPSSGPYNRICLSATTSGISVSANNFNGATGTLSFLQNGSPLPAQGLQAGTGIFISGGTPTTISVSNAPLSVLSNGGSVGGLIYDNGALFTELAGNGGAQQCLSEAVGVPSWVPCYNTYTGGTGITVSSVVGNAATISLNGTISGSSGIFATAAGVLTNGNCVSINNGSFVDAGGPCTVGGGGGTVSSGLAKQLAYYASSGTTVSGLATANSSVLKTDGSGNPGWSTTLPSGLTVPSATLSSPTLSGTITGLPVATSSVQGIVQGDGSTLTITAGTISCTTATTLQVGCSKPDGTTISVSGGVLTAVGAALTVGSTVIGGGTSNGVLFNNAGVLGNTAAGTSGYHLVSNGAGSAPTYQAFLQAGTSAVNRTWQSKAADVFSVQDFGAVDDNSTDNQAFINAAITKVEGSGGILYFPVTSTGIYVVNSGFNASAVLFAAKPIQIVCAPGVWIKPGGAITNSQSIMYFRGATFTGGYVQTRTIFDGCNIGDPSFGTRTGNNGIVFDTLANGETFLSPLVRNVTVTAANQGTNSCLSSEVGCAILVANVNTNTTGGTLWATFEHATLAGGVYLANAGDSITLRDVVFPPNTAASGSNFGVYANLISGAGGLLLDAVNCQAKAGCLVVDNSTSTFVKNPNWEQISQTINSEPNNAMVDLGSSVAAASGNVGPVVIQGGSITSSDCTQHPFLLTFNNNAGSYFSGLRIGHNCATYPHAMTQMLGPSSNITIGVNWWNKSGVVVTSNRWSNSGTNNAVVSTAAAGASG